MTDISDMSPDDIDAEVNRLLEALAACVREGLDSEIKGIRADLEAFGYAAHADASGFTLARAS